MILSLCDIPDVLRVMKIIKTVLLIIEIVVPIILIITSMVSFMKAITNDKDNLNESLKAFVKKAIAALLIFLVPTFINIIVKTVAPDNPYVKCFNYEGSIQASYIAHMEELIKEAKEKKSSVAVSQARLYLQKIENEEKRKEYEKILNDLEEEINEPLLDPDIVDHITINTPVTQMKVGATFQISIAIVPNSAKDKDVTWTSSDPSVVEVDNNGKLTAKKTGVSTIKVTLNSNNKISAETTVTVIEGIDHITINTTSVQMKVKETFNMSIGVVTSASNSKEVIWTSSDPSVVEVDNNGKLTAKKAGTSKITVTLKSNESISASTIVAVTSGVDHITINTPVTQMKVGATFQINIAIVPTTALDKEVTWTSSDPSVVEVDNTGKLTAKKAGVSTIKVLLNSNNKISAGTTITVSN